MSAFVIVDIEVTDPVRYEEYKARAGATVTQYGGRFVVRGGPAQVLEGDWQPARVVVLEFPTVGPGMLHFLHVNRSALRAPKG